MPRNTEDKIIEVAERMFAERGVDGTSLRDITGAAGVNVAAVNYHFGSKDGLLEAVLNRVVEPLVALRLELLEEALERSGGAPLELEEILDAFVRPDLVTIERLRDRGPTVARFVARMYAQPSPLVERLMHEQFRPCAERFFPEIARALPGVPIREIEWRMGCVVAVIVALFAAATPRGTPGPFDTEDVEGTLARIIQFVGPGLAAPAGAHALAAEGRR